MDSKSLYSKGFFTLGGLIILVEVNYGPPSHSRMRARDHCTSSTLIGGKGGAGSSSQHYVLEGPME